MAAARLRVEALTATGLLEAERGLFGRGRKGVLRFALTGVALALDLDDVALDLDDVPPGLGDLVLDLGDVPPALGDVAPSLGDVPPGLDGVALDLDDVPSGLGDVPTGLDDVAPGLAGVALGFGLDGVAPVDFLVTGGRTVVLFFVLAIGVTGEGGGDDSLNDSAFSAPGWLNLSGVARSKRLYTGLQKETAATTRVVTVARMGQFGTSPA